MFNIYILRHAITGRSYVGISTDPQRRLRQHNGELTGGARCTTRMTPDWEVLEVSKHQYNRSDAMRLERLVKKSRGAEKRLESLRRLDI
jgi:predicted GIY-YIG superfamily endonuclease